MKHYNARFWTFYRGSWVKITLRPKQSLSAGYSESTDEGCHYQAETWTHEGDKITCSWVDGGRDCDGPIRRTGDCECPVYLLVAVPACVMDKTARVKDWLFNDKHIYRPDWKKVGRESVHDAFAEAAGY